MFKNKLAKRLLTVSFAVAVLCAASLSKAGMKWVYPFRVDVSSRWVEGSLGSVRASGNSHDYLGCWINGNATGGALSCYGYDGTNSLTCYHPKSKPNYTPLLAAVQSLNGDSLLQFKVNTDGTCAEIYVTNASYWAPKAP